MNTPNESLFGINCELSTQAAPRTGAQELAKPADLDPPIHHSAFYQLRVAENILQLTGSWRRAIWLATWLILATLLAWRGRLDIGDPEPSFTSTHAETAKQTIKTRRIANLRVGDRVLGHNPLRDEVTSEGGPQPANWRMLELRMTEPGGKHIEMVLLRSLSWMNSHKVRVGSTVAISLPEMGAEGQASVLAISPCPAIKAGNGEVVTGTFRHQPDKELVSLTVEGLDSPIICTANHRFWSVDQKDFVSAGKLQAGEQLQGQDNAVFSVLEAHVSPAVNYVYNIEVHGEHVYHVSQRGILVHNSCPVDIALGLRITSDGKEVISVLKKPNSFANADWIGKKLANPGPFTARFAEALDNAIASKGRIHFHLDYLDIDRALKTDLLTGTTDDLFDMNAFTNYELQQVLNNPKYYDATDFLLGGQDNAADVLDFGLHFRGMR